MFAFWFPHRLTALRTPFTVAGEGISRFWKQQESFFHVLLKKCSESEASTAQPVLAVWHWKTVWLSKLERFLSPSFNFNGGKVKEKNCKRGYSFRLHTALIYEPRKVAFVVFQWQEAMLYIYFVFITFIQSSLTTTYREEIKTYLLS